MSLTLRYYDRIDRTTSHRARMPRVFYPEIWIFFCFCIPAAEFLCHCEICSVEQQDQTDVTKKARSVVCLDRNVEVLERLGCPLSLAEPLGSGSRVVVLGSYPGDLVKS